MTVAVDSKLHKDSTDKQKVFAATKMDTVKGSKPMRMMKTVEFKPSSQYYTNELNGIAWTYYTMTHNPEQLKKAIAWAKRANEFFENFGAMDTYSRLLYKTGNRTEAINWQEKAIALSKKRGYGTTELQEILDRMKNGSDKIDSY
jgi:hypothetical protein